MTSLGLKKKDALFLLIYFMVFFILIFFSLNYNKENSRASYSEIPFQDSLLCVNEKAFETSNEVKNNKKSFYFKYQPISTIEQTYNSAISKKKKIYTFNFQEINITPSLQEVRINRVKVSLSKIYELKKNAHLISFKFKEINYLDRKLKFQFSDSKNGTYEDFANDNTLNINLPDGKLNLYIRAVDFKSKITTKYFKTITTSEVDLSKRDWYLPFLFLLIMAPFVYYFLRIKRYQQEFNFKEKLALEMKRNKITADLHDDIGATLSSLQLNSAVANQLMIKNPNQALKLLEKVEQQSKDLADKIGDIIWSMKPGKDEFLTMSSRIKNFANDILGSTNIEYKIKIDKKADKSITDITTRKNIVLFIKEATNNAAKYSKASLFEIKLEFIENNIQIKINDNGIGFNVASTNGNGIRNMKQRIDELNGQFSIDSKPKNGTRIKAVIPFVA